MINLVGLNKKYNDTIIFENVNICFPTCGFIGIIGKSGIGKTTLLNILSLMDNQYEGEIFIDEINYKDIVDIDSFRGNNFSYIFQENDLIATMSIEDNISIDGKADVDTILKKVRLNVDKKKTVNTLSGGEYKRVSLARSIAKGAKILFIDEAISSLDKENKIIILEILKSLSKERLIIFVSHDENLLREYSDKIYRIENKKIIGSTYDNQKKQELIFKKKKMPLSFKIKYVKSKINNKKFRKIMILFTMVLSILSFSISSLVISILQNSLTSSLFTLVDENLIVGRMKEKSDDIDEIYNTSYVDALLIKEKYPMLVDYIGVYYFSNFESQLKTQNQFYIKIDDTNFVLDDIGIRSVNDYEIDQSYNLSFEQIVLKIDYQTMESITTRLHIANDIETLKTHLSSNGLSCCFSLINEEWDYYKDINFTIADVILGAETAIVHSSLIFNEYIFENIMQFEVSGDLITSDAIPWTLKKVYYIKIDLDKSEEVLNILMKDQELKHISYDYLELVPFTDFDLREKALSGRICLLKRNNHGIPFYYLNKFDNDVSYSFSSIYYLIDTLMIESFVNTLFITSSKTDDEMIETEYNISKINLNKNKISFDENIVTGGFINLGDYNNVLFKRSDGEELIGNVPLYLDEIVISKKLALNLFPNLSLENILNKTIYFKTVREVIDLKGDYHHKFKTSPLKVVGITFDEKSNILYQNKMWPMHFYSKRLGFPLSELSVDALILKDQNDVKKYSDAYPLLSFKNPSKEFKASIDNVISYIEKGLISFGVIEGVLSFISLVVILYLYISENKKEIGVFLLIGYSKSDIKNLFGFFALYLGISAWIYSIVSLFVSSIFIEMILLKTVTFDFISTWLYLSVFLFLIISFLTSIIGYCVSNSTLKNCQMDILKRKN